MSGKHLIAKTVATTAMALSIGALAAPTANAEQPSWVPEPTPALQVGSSNIGICANVPIWPWPAIGIYLCI
jgi:hypothetical protein